MGIYLLCVVCESEKRHQNSPPLHSASLKNYQHKSTDQEVGISQVLQKISLFTQFENDVETHKLLREKERKLNVEDDFFMYFILNF